MGDKSYVFSVFISCFILDLSTILYDWLMIFCLQKVKKVYSVDYVPKERSNPKSLFNKHAFLSIALGHLMRQ